MLTFEISFNLERGEMFITNSLTNTNGIAQLVCIVRRHDEASYSNFPRLL